MKVILFSPESCMTCSERNRKATGYCFPNSMQPGTSYALGGIGWMVLKQGCTSEAPAVVCVQNESGL